MDSNKAVLFTPAYSSAQPEEDKKVREIVENMKVKGLDAVVIPSSDHDFCEFWPPDKLGLWTIGFRHSAMIKDYMSANYPEYFSKEEQFGTN